MNLNYYNQICLNFLHSEALARLKYCSSTLAVSHSLALLKPLSHLVKLSLPNMFILWAYMFLKRHGRFQTQIQTSADEKLWKAWFQYSWHTYSSKTQGMFSEQIYLSIPDIGKSVKCTPNSLQLLGQLFQPLSWFCIKVSLPLYEKSWELQFSSPYLLHCSSPPYGTFISFHSYAFEIICLPFCDGDFLFTL